MTGPARFTLTTLAILAGFSASAATVGRLSVSSNPSSTVYLDGQPMGKTPVNRLKIMPGQHRILLKNTARGSSVEFEVSISEGRHLTCSYNFDTGEQECSTEKSGAVSKHGTLHLYSTPAASVQMDGKEIGKTPLENLRVDEGHHALEFSSEGFDPIVREVDVGAAQSVKVNVEFTPSKKKEE